MASVEEQAVSLIYMLYLMTLSSTSGILNSSSFGARMMSIAMLGLAIVFLLFIFFVCIADCPILLTSGLLIIGLANEINCLDFHNFIGKMVAYAVDATFPSAILFIIAAIASFLAFNYVMSKVYFLLLWLYKKTKLIKIPDLSELDCSDPIIFDICFRTGFEMSKAVYIICILSFINFIFSLSLLF